MSEQPSGPGSDAEAEPGSGDAAGSRDEAAGDGAPTAAGRDEPSTDSPSDGPAAGADGDPDRGDQEPNAGADGDPDGGEREGEGEEASPDGAESADATPSAGRDVPEDVRTYERFQKVDGAQYRRVNDFLRERTYITAREWAIARLCADFRTETGVEMTKIGEHLPELVPFMEDTYTPQAVNQARASFEEKVRTAGATFLYGAMCDFFTAEELDELMYEVTEVAKFLLEVEGVDLSVEEELEAEDRISTVMREVREASEALRYEECPHCGERLHE